MGTKLHLDPAAEKEATDIGRKFMHSTDVVGDMSRAYGADLSSVRIHTDESAAQRAAQRGVDAFSTGRDIFFARSAFDRGDSASRGLLAHELGHSLQQGVGLEGAPAMAQSAPMGAAQGGLLDWFREKKRRREIRQMEISEPELMEGPINKEMIDEKGDSITRNFLTAKSAALNEMLQGATREQLRDEKLQQLVIEDYNTNMNARLRSLNGLSKQEMDAQAFRGSAGELNNMNYVLPALLYPKFANYVISTMQWQGPDAAMDKIGVAVGTDRMKNFLGALNPSFEGIDNYANPEDRSAIMMNNLVLRTVNGQISNRIGREQKELYKKLKKERLAGQKRKLTREEDQALSDEVGRSVNRKDLIDSMKLQKIINTGGSRKALDLQKRFVNLFR